MLWPGKLRNCEVYRVGGVRCISMRGHPQDAERGLVMEVDT